MRTAARRTSAPDTLMVSTIAREAHTIIQGLQTKLEAFVAAPATNTITPELRQLADTSRLILLRGPLRFFEAARELATQIETSRVSGVAALPVLQASLSTLARYFNTAISGRIDPALSIFDAYLSIVSLLPGTKALTQDEFYLTFVHRAPPDPYPIDGASFGAAVKPYHGEYRGAFMRFAKNKASGELALMRQALLTIETKSPPNACRLFLSAAIATLDAAMRVGEFPQQKEHLLARIDRELSSYTRGEFVLADNNLSAVLYFVALAEPSNIRIERLQSSLNLCEHLPPGIPVALDERALAEIAAFIEAAKNAWDGAFGEAPDPAKARAAAFSLASACAICGDVALKSLALTLGALGDAVANGMVPSNQAIAVLGASILLDAEQRIARIQDDPLGGRATAALQKKRVQAALAGKNPDSVIGHPDTEATGHLRKILEEASADVGALEQMLEQAIKDPSNTDKASEVNRVFSNVKSAVLLCGLRDGAALVDASARYAADILESLARAESIQDIRLSRLADVVVNLGKFTALAQHSNAEASAIAHASIELLQRKNEAPAQEIEAAVVAGAGNLDSCFDDPEICGVFFEETKTNIVTILQKCSDLRSRPDEETNIVRVRRAWHTLKGSARTVFLEHLGELAYALEQAFNHAIHSRKPAGPALLALSEEAARDFLANVDELARTGKTLVRDAYYIGASNGYVAGTLEFLSEKQNDLTRPGTSVSVSPKVADSVPPLDRRAIAQSVVAGDNVIFVDDTALPAEPNAQELFLPLEVVATSAETSENLSCEASMSADAADPTGGVPCIALPALATRGDGLSIVPNHLRASRQVAGGSTSDDDICVGLLRIPKAVFDVFIEESANFFAALSAEIHCMLANDPHVVTHEIMRLSHSLAGMGRTTGVTPLTEIAGTIEEWAAMNAGHCLHVDDEMRGTFKDALEVIDAILLGLRDGVEPQRETLILSRIQTLLQRAGHELAGSSQHTFQDSDSSAQRVALEPTSSIARAPVVAVAALATAASPSASTELAKEAGVAGSKVANALAGASHGPARISTNSEPATNRYASHTGSEWLDLAHEKTDDIDFEAFEFFLEEASVRFSDIDALTIELLKDPSDRKRADAMKRAIHTLKGGASTAGARRAAAVLHFLEDLMAATPRLDGATLDILQSGVDAAHRMVKEAERDILAAKRVEEPDGRPAELVATTSASPAPDTASPITRPTGSRSASGQGESDLQLKLSAKGLEYLLNLSGEVNLSRARIGVQVHNAANSLRVLDGNVSRLVDLLAAVSLEAEKQMSSGNQSTASSKHGFDALEFDRFTILQELTRRISEASSDITDQSTSIGIALSSISDIAAHQGVLSADLSGSLDRVRQIRLSTIVPHLKRVVRQACRDTGKQAELIVDADVEVDRAILERMMGAIEHILRNAVAHGIELPSDRLASDKPESGLIEFKVTNDAAEIVIDVRDDGAGLNRSRILTKAIERGLISTGEGMSHEEVVELLFVPGFSTATEVSGIAGRGIGLDAVRAAAASIGGRVFLTSTEGAGSLFTLRIPSTLSVMNGLAAYTNDLMYVLPVAFVDRLCRFSPTQLEHAYRSGEVTLEDDGTAQKYRFLGLWNIVGLNTWTGKPVPRNPVLLMRDERLAVHVDEVYPSEEFVFKQIGSQIRAQSGILGATINSSGNASLVVDPVRIVRLQKTVGRAAPEKQEVRAPLVLVVDDSTTIRKMTRKVLTRAGFRIAEAEDGMRALESLVAEIPAIILMDIEMPVMDGFECTRAIRANTATALVPIIMISSRAADKHRKIALEAGVNEYLGKPYKEQELLTLIREYLSKKDDPAAADRSATKV
jgi:chemotaxis protein histidine kinase CheA/ActR/RegA family two-component response regulator